MDLPDCYQQVRKLTEQICSPLQTEDYVVQPIADVSPPKWHLGHTSWFFETFILKPYFMGYQEFDPQYNFVFNSYYETVGRRVIRTDRGNLSRPTVADIYKYREYVDEAMEKFLCEEPSKDVKELLILGLNHEQQHQELLYTDIKYILGHNPLFPAYSNDYISPKSIDKDNNFIAIKEGIYEIGYDGDGFCFDNELARHKVYLQPYEIALSLVTNREYLEFINAGGYQDFRHWHAEGWDWVNKHQVTAPLYWHNIDGEWQNYTYAGLKPIEWDQALCHISYFEASAYAAWKGLRLPTEFEWEVAANQFDWGLRWEWTESAYLPYPGFVKAPGAIGEYNGKFMVNQQVLRGASEVTSPGHSRITYRNFFKHIYNGNLPASDWHGNYTINTMGAPAIILGAYNLKKSKTDAFYKDVITGLRSVPKRLNSKYFYDAKGDKIFQEIMNCPEYYPTRCEMEIFSKKTAELGDALIAGGDAFDLIELGAGDATKSSHLLKYLLDQKADFNYLPIDISENVISYLNTNLPVKLPGLQINGLNGEYFDMLKQAATLSNRRKIVLFLGSNIGNMLLDEGLNFCKALREHLSEGDMVLMGFDLKKNPRTVLAAYNDKEGITRRFNLNLLERINRELNADFHLSKFDHYPTYDPETGACRSFLISLEDQEVTINNKEHIRFQKDEYIYMEISQKFTVLQTEQIAANAGFKAVNCFFDSKKWFLDAIWVAE